MNKADREGVKRARLDTNTDLDAYGAVRWYGFDVLPRRISPRWWAEVERDFLAVFKTLTAAARP